MKLEIGDSFIIDWKQILKHYPKLKVCKDPNRVFIAKTFSNSGLSVYFDDFRTNKKGCKCSICSDNKTEKCTGLYCVVLKEKYLSLQREIKFKKLGL
jgi:hypothetical protein